jgi:hypothetical protein
VLTSGPGDVACQAAELGDDRAATALEIGDLLFDLASAPVGVRDQLLCGPLAGLLCLGDQGVGVGAQLRRVLLGGGASLLERGLRLHPRLFRLGVGARARPRRVGVGVLAKLLGVVLGLRPHLLRLEVRVGEQLAYLAVGVRPHRLRRVVSLGQDRSRLLADPLELVADDVGARLVRTSGLEPVGKLIEKLVDLAALVAAAGLPERGTTNSVDRIAVHSASVARSR